MVFHKHTLKPCQLLQAQPAPRRPTKLNDALGTLCHYAGCEKSQAILALFDTYPYPTWLFGCQSAQAKWKGLKSPWHSARNSRFPERQQLHFATTNGTAWDSTRSKSPRLQWDDQRCPSCGRALFKDDAESALKVPRELLKGIVERDTIDAQSLDWIWKNLPHSMVFLHRNTGFSLKLPFQTDQGDCVSSRTLSWRDLVFMSWIQLDCPISESLRINDWKHHVGDMNYHYHII